MLGHDRSMKTLVAGTWRKMLGLTWTFNNLQQQLYQLYLHAAPRANICEQNMKKHFQCSLYIYIYRHTPNLTKCMISFRFIKIWRKQFQEVTKQNWTELVVHVSRSQVTLFIEGNFCLIAGLCCNTTDIMEALQSQFWVQFAKLSHILECKDVQPHLI